jgi:bifunctional non-homologous end joining protein LigD
MEEHYMAPTARRGGKAGRSRSGGGEPLAEYRRKRDFDRTREPSGDVTPGSRTGLRFVIQKHAASQLHYDLRLELDGVMLSWAVPKGPSLDPSVKRLAMQVEDHPIEYNTFEGTIPQGEYGGGTVMLWDRGTYTPDERAGVESAASAVRRGIRAGKLSFTFHGERLNGSFALVRTARGDKPKWLLIKHRDHDADEGPEITDAVRTSVATGRTMEEIAAGNDRVWRSNRGGQAGGEEAGAGSAAAPMIAPMRPTPATAVPDEGDWMFEPWLGGRRVLAYATAQTAALMDEQGEDVTSEHRGIADELASLAKRVGRSFVIEGEIAADDTASGSDDAQTFYAGDLLLDGDSVLLDLPFTERREAMESLFRRRRLKRSTLQQVDARAETVLRRAARGGWPGIVARRADATYEPGRATDAVLRIALH